MIDDLQKFREALAFIYSSCESIEGARIIARNALGITCEEEARRREAFDKFWQEFHAGRVV